MSANPVAKTPKDSSRRSGGRRPKRKLKRAFAVDESLLHRRGPVPLVASITYAQMQECVGEILGGVTPFVAAGTVFGVSAQTHFNWMQLGRKPESPKAYRDYFDEVHRAEMQARGGLEKRIYRRSEEFYAARSPIFRTKPDAPGWTDERPSVAVGVGVFAGDKGERFELKFGPLGPKSELIQETKAIEASTVESSDIE